MLILNEINGASWDHIKFVHLIQMSNGKKKKEIIVKKMMLNFSKKLCLLFYIYI